MMTTFVILSEARAAREVEGQSEVEGRAARIMRARNITSHEMEVR